LFTLCFATRYACSFGAHLLRPHCLCGCSHWCVTGPFLFRASAPSNDLLYSVILYGTAGGARGTSAPLLLPPLLPQLSLKLLPALLPGGECYAAFLLSEAACKLPTFIKAFFLPQLLSSKRRVAQVAHSAKMKGLPSTTSGLGPYSISTLRDAVSVQAQEEDTTLLLPLGDDFVMHLLTSVANK